MLVRLLDDGASAMRVDVGVINVPTSVGARAWRACFLAIAARCAIFGINEVFTRRAKTLFLALAKARGFRQYGARKSPNPVFWKWRRYAKVSGRIIRLHDRLSRYAEWPGFNDARYVTEVILRRRGRRRRHLPQIVILCTHLVAEGTKVDPADREAARRTSLATLRALIVEHQDAGRIVVLIGDLNVHDRINLAIRGFTWIRPLGVDKVGIAVPDGYELTDADFDLFPAKTDHKHGVDAHARVEAAA